MQDTDFRLTVEALLNKYDGTPLQSRWQEAISFGSGPMASDYWTRDSDNAVNIVWLNGDGIRDVGMIEYVPHGGDSPIREAAFSFVPLKSIGSIEIREGSNIARRFALPYSGTKIALVTLTAPQGHLYWVANLEDEEERLSTFVTSVLCAYLHAR